MHFRKTTNCQACLELGEQTHKKCAEILKDGVLVGYACRTAFKLGVLSLNSALLRNNGSQGDFCHFFWIKTEREKPARPKPVDFEALIADAFCVSRSGLQPYCASGAIKDLLHRAVIDNSTLEQRHVLLLQQRGLYPDLPLDDATQKLKRLGFITLRSGIKCPITYPKYHPLPGFGADGIYQSEDPQKRPVEGLAIPKTNALGQLLLWQIKPDNGKYLYPAQYGFEADWALTRKHDIRTGRLPLNVATFATNPVRVLYTEGVLKSILTAYRHRDSVVVGGEGSLYCSELALRLELATILDRHPEVEPVVYLAPDTGSAWTQTHLIKQLAGSIQSCNWDYRILDWGQLFEAKSQLLDPDEVDPSRLNHAELITGIVAPDDLQNPEKRAGFSTASRAGTVATPGS